jgi:hypothetical protein
VLGLTYYRREIESRYIGRRSPGSPIAGGQSRSRGPRSRWAGRRGRGALVGRSRSLSPVIVVGRDVDIAVRSSGEQASRQLERVAAVRLDPIARLARDRARRAYHHLDPRRPSRPRQTKPGRPSLIHRAHRPWQRPQPLDRCRRPTAQTRAEHLPRPQLHRGRHGLARMNIQPGKADTVGHVDASHLRNQPAPSKRGSVDLLRPASRRPIPSRWDRRLRLVGGLAQGRAGSP